MSRRYSVVTDLAAEHLTPSGAKPPLYLVKTSGGDSLCLQRWRQALPLHCIVQILCKKRIKSLWWRKTAQDRTLHPLCRLLRNEYAYGRVCVCLRVLMCVVVCELSHTPPHLCLSRLISAVHKGGLCASQDRLIGQRIHCLTTASCTHANRYAPLSSQLTIWALRVWFSEGVMHRALSKP